MLADGGTAAAAEKSLSGTHLDICVLSRNALWGGINWVVGEDAVVVKVREELRAALDRV